MSRRDHGSHGQRGAAPSAPKRPALNEYWIDGEGILREVLQSEICRFLGAEATCRPGDLNGRQGFKIRALRPFTPEMLEDLREASGEFRTETRALQDRYDKGTRGGTSSPKGPSKGIAVSYEDSETRRRNEPQLSQHYQEPPRSGYPVGSPYAENPPYPNMAPGYGSNPGYPSGSGYPPSGGQYPPGAYGSMPPSMGSTPSYASGPADPRYQPHYTTYVNQPPRGDYQQPDRYGYAPEPGYATEPPRSRGDQASGSFAYGGRGGPADRPPMGAVPREYNDYEMGGTSAGHGYGGPPRGQAPSPYDTSRDHYGASRPQPDPYAGSRRR